MTTLLPDTRAGNLVVWAALVLAVAAWTARTQRSASSTTIAQVIGLVRRWWIGRWGLLAGWAWLGWHLFVRTHH